MKRGKGNCHLLIPLTVTWTCAIYVLTCICSFNLHKTLPNRYYELCFPPASQKWKVKFKENSNNSSETTSESSYHQVCKPFSSMSICFLFPPVTTDELSLLLAKALHRCLPDPSFLPALLCNFFFFLHLQFLLCWITAIMIQIGHQAPIFKSSLLTLYSQSYPISYLEQLCILIASVSSFLSLPETQSSQATVPTS